jgi:YVTN family beta-propeller protein
MRAHRIARPFALLGLLAAALCGLALGLFPAFPAYPAAAFQAEPTALPLYALPNASFETAAMSGSIALSPFDARIAANVNMLSDTVTLSLPAQGRIIAETPVGDDPRGVAFTPTGDRVLVANRGSGTLSVLDPFTAEVTATIALGGVWPYGVVAARDGLAYVSLIGSSEIAVVDVALGRETARIAVPAFPAGLAAWGDFLYVTHFWDGRVSLVYLPDRRVIETIATGADVGLSQALALDITRGLAYQPATLLNPGARAPFHDTAAFPAVNVVRLADLGGLRAERLALSTIDQPLNMPFAAALDRFNQRLYIVNAGDDSLTVIDLFTRAVRGHVAVGSNPRGVVLSGDAARAFVHNALEGTITIVSAASLTVEDVLPVTRSAVPIDVLIGAARFHAADPQMSAGGWQSCATCHFDGMSDGRIWQMGDITGPHAGLRPERATPLLYGLDETVPYYAGQTADELADVEWKIRGWQGGEGLLFPPDLPNPPLGAPNSGRSPDLDALTTYLLSIPPPPRSPFVFAADVLERGQAVYEAEACASCHVGPVGTNLQAVEGVDTPSLRWLWLSAPYLYDGRAPTLRAVFEQDGIHQLTRRVSTDDIDALIAYLLAERPGA